MNIFRPATTKLKIW